MMIFNVYKNNEHMADLDIPVSGRYEENILTNIPYVSTWDNDSFTMLANKIEEEFREAKGQYLMIGEDMEDIGKPHPRSLDMAIKETIDLIFACKTILMRLTKLYLEKDDVDELVSWINFMADEVKAKNEKRGYYKTSGEPDEF